MGRVFTIDFNFHDQSYQALITQLEKCIIISIPDKKLHHILPEGKFIYCPNQDEVKISLPNRSAEKLVKIILETVEKECSRSGKKEET